MTKEKFASEILSNTAAFTDTWIGNDVQMAFVQAMDDVKKEKAPAYPPNILDKFLPSDYISTWPGELRKYFVKTLGTLLYWMYEKDAKQQFVKECFRKNEEE